MRPVMKPAAAYTLMTAMMLVMGGAAEAAVLLGKRDMEKPAGYSRLRWRQAFR